MNTSDMLESMPHGHIVKPHVCIAVNYMSSKDFGERVLQSRLRLAAKLKRKLSQEDIALMMGVAQTTYGRWENGLKEPQDLATWERLAAVLRVSPEWLAFGRGRMELDADATLRASPYADVPEEPPEPAEDVPARPVRRKGSGD